MFEKGQLLDNKYRVESHIGTGGGGIVYKAYHISMDRYVAIKQIKSEVRGVLNDNGEARILKDLKNDYIPSVYDFITDGGEVYTVMEFVEGQSFEQLIGSGRKFSQKRLLKFARQLCEAVAYLHSRKPPIVHSDIKPANIMLTPEDNICLIDYNISLIVDGNESTVGISEGYSPPEQYGYEYSGRGETEGKRTVCLETEDSDTAVGDTEYTGYNAARDDTGAADLTHAPGSGSDGGVTELTEVLRNDGDTVAAALTDSSESGNALSGTALTGVLEAEKKISGTVCTGVSVNIPDISQKGDRARKASAGGRVRRHVDRRSDIYSIGAALYAIASGRRPGASTGYVKPLSQMETGLGESFTAIIEKAMAQKPGDRFSGAEQMLAALDNIRKYDGRYKRLVIRQELAAFIVIAGMALSCLTAVMGYMRLGEEASLQYDTLLAEMDSSDISEAEIYLDEASSIFPDRAEAYEKMAFMLYSEGDYAGGARFTENVLEMGRLYSGDRREEYSGGELYYILGRCYMNMEDCEEAAAQALEAAVEAGGEDSYYCDYAVALARCGEAERAQAALDIAEKRGISGSDILFVRGEVSFALGEYRQCIDALKGCISEGEGKEYIYRAYDLAAQAYEQLTADFPETGEEMAGFLQEAIEALPMEKTLPFYEKLAQGYTDMAESMGNDMYYSEALAVYEEMNKQGWETVEGDCVCLWIFRRIGNYPAGKDFGEGALKRMGEDYRIYKRLAFIESDIQNKQKNQLRDYSDFFRYCERAAELCDDEEDPEMARLDEAYKKAKERG